MAISPPSMIDPASGVINPTIVSYAQAGTVNKVSKATFATAEIASVSISEDAHAQIAKESSQVSHLVSSAGATEIKDEENKERPKQDLDTQDKDDDDKHEEEDFEEQELLSNVEELLLEDSEKEEINNLFVGNILNLKV